MCLSILFLGDKYSNPQERPGWSLIGPLSTRISARGSSSRRPNAKDQAKVQVGERNATSLAMQF